MRPLYLKLSLAILLAAMALMPASSERPARRAKDQHVRLPEVRLRKLHLVRPDLIPYPIYFEVYC